MAGKNSRKNRSTLSNESQLKKPLRFHTETGAMNRANTISNKSSLLMEYLILWFSLLLFLSIVDFYFDIYFLCCYLRFNLTYSLLMAHSCCALFHLYTARILPPVKKTPSLHHVPGETIVAALSSMRYMNFCELSYAHYVYICLHT